MTKSIKEQTTRAFQVGGYNPAATTAQQPYGQPAGVDPQTGVYQLPGTGVAGYYTPGGTSTGYTPYGGAQPYFQPVQFTGPQFQTALQTTNLPTFAETVGSAPGQYDELKTYINDAGQTLQIPFKFGQPIYPIPEGYRLKEEEEATTPTVQPTTGTGVQTGGGEGGDRDVGVTSTTRTETPTALSLGSIFGGLTGGGSVFGTSPGQAESYKGTALSNIGAAGFSSTPSNSLAGQQAGVADALGIYGNEGFNAGIIGSLLTGNVLGVMASASGIGPNTQIGAISAPTGFGKYSTEDLTAYASGNMSKAQQNELGITMNQAQALQRAQVQKAIRTPLTGQFGFSPGSIDPNTGQPYDAKGRLVNTNGSSTGVEPAFSDVGSWIDAVESSIKSGYWGGPLTDAEYDNLSPSGKAKYDEKATDNGWEGGGVSTGKGAEGRLGDPSKGGEVSATPGGTAKGTPGPTSGRADYSGGYQGYESASASSSASDNAADDEAGDTSVGSNNDDAGDDRGSSGPGNAGSGSSCFAAGTKFFMEDGSLKNIEDIKIGDVLQRGGKVRTTIVGDGLYENWYLYGNTKVTGTHTVFENGTWKRVANSDKAIPTDKDEFIYTLVNEKHRLIAEDGVMYGDYDEVDNLDIEDGLLEMMNLQDAVEEAA